MNEQQILLAFGGIGAAALGCQWLAWRLLHSVRCPEVWRTRHKSVLVSSRKLSVENSVAASVIERPRKQHHNQILNASVIVLPRLCDF